MKNLRLTQQSLLSKLKFRHLLLIIICIFITSCSEQTKIDTNTSACEILAQHSSWKATLKNAQNKYNLSPAFAMGIIYQESRFKADAKSKHSSAYGYAQALDNTWKHYQTEVKSNARRDNFSDSVGFIGWYMSQLSKSTNLKMTDSTNLYIAYMLGATGYKRYKAGTFKNKTKIAQDKKIAAKVTAYTKLYSNQLTKCS